MRRLPDPAIMLMHGDLSAMKPTWGPCGVWRWWPWRDLSPASGSYRWDLVDAYLDAAAAQGRAAAISIMLYPDINQDCTPKWVYGSGAGWPIVGGAGTFPKWNDYLWDAALAQFIAAFGKRYDGDPRVHSVWITFAKYGETVTDGLGSDLHNPGRYFRNAIGWYDAAFPNTPLAALITGPTDRLALAELCWERGIAPKFNALCRDVPTHVQLKPVAGAGHAEIALKSRELGIPVAWEHYYPANAKETYWAILTFLALGGMVLDLPAAHLDALASIPGLWRWALEVMQANQELVGFYAARDTQYPAPGNGWEHGWPGPWERNITTTATCYAPGSAGYKSAPVSLTGTLEGYGGIGWCKDGLTVTATLPEGEYSVETTYAPEKGDNWITHYMVTTLPGSLPICADPCWVHRVVALPYDGPVEPDDEDKPDADLTAIRSDITRLDALTTSLDMAQDAQAERLAELDAALVRLESRIAALEDSKAAALEALGQFRESLV
jgi:hypothetical protein